MFIKVKVISRSRSYQGQSHSRSGYIRSRSLKIKVISWSMSSQGHSHFEVEVILNQMVMCFDFYPKAGGWLSSECLSLLVCTCYQSRFFHCNAPFDPPVHAIARTDKSYYLLLLGSCQNPRFFSVREKLYCIFPIRLLARK